MNNQVKENAKINKWLSKFRGPPGRKRQKPEDERIKLLKEAKKQFDAKKSEVIIKKKDFKDSVADKLLELVFQGKTEDVDLIKTLLDKLCRQSINGGLFNNRVIRAAQKFIRDVESSNKKKQK